jgi:hypothetical protein
MRSAACYTNKVKVVAQAKNTKVNYPGGEAKNWDKMYATLGCNPNFAVQTYVVPPECGQRKIFKCIRLS